MNKIKTTTSLLCISIVSCTNFLCAEAESSKNKIVVIATVSGQEVMMNSDTGKTIQERLRSAQEKLATPLQKESEVIQAKQQKIIEKEKDSKADKSAIDFEKRELGLQIQKLQAEGQKVEEKLGEMYKKEMGKFEAAVKESIKDLAQRYGWDLVLMEEPAVYVNKKAISKTAEVITELDRRTKAANLAKKQALENDSKKDGAPKKDALKKSEDDAGQNSY